MLVSLCHQGWCGVRVTDIRAGVVSVSLPSGLVWRQSGPCPPVVWTGMAAVWSVSARRHQEHAECHPFFMAPGDGRNHDFRYLAAGHLFYLSGRQCIHHGAIMAAITVLIRV